jgi:hypothetical protein
MATMKKKLISLSEPLAAWVTQQAEKHGVSVSEEIRMVLSKERAHVENKNASRRPT